MLNGIVLIILFQGKRVSVRHYTPMSPAMVKQKKIWKVIRVTEVNL